MKKFILYLLFLVFFHACVNRPQQSKSELNALDPVDYVNPFIGTDAHGHTYPGASFPFGMVQLSPDTRLEGWDGCSGYHYSDSILFGFSHTALSGTGVPDYADILFMPTSGKVMLGNGKDNVDDGYASRFSHQNESAEAGYYQVYLNDYNINVELTTSRRVGFHRYTFAEVDTGNILVDLFHRDKVLDSWIRIINDHEIEGYRRSTSWATDQHLYFCAEFSAPFIDYGLALNEKIQTTEYLRGDNIKAFFKFDVSDSSQVLVKVGLSAVSADGARKNKHKEIQDWDFDLHKDLAKQAWSQELKKIEVSGGSEEQLITFYSALYHAFLVPNLFQDVDGQFRGRDLGIHQTDDFEYYSVFSLWDTFRAEHPLFTLVQQERTNDLINTMIRQYEDGGRLPVWELAANETECMIGYHSIPVIADAYIKGIRDYDAEKAFEAMKHSAELDHFGLKYYKMKGFIPANEESESVSKTLEYAYDDWCIAQMARKMDKMEDYEHYIRRSQYYKNVFDHQTGFMRAKMNGRWFEPFDPREVNFNYTEANSWQYSFFVPHDLNGLIELMGGQEKLVDRLDQLFSESSETTGRQQSDITGLIGQYAHGNEPSHHMAYLYNYVGQPWKTQLRAREIMDELYTHLPDGLCGNEDCGQMSAWYVLSAMGFYPVTPAHPIYTFGSPLFDKCKINLENGSVFTIKTIDNSKENIYIQSVKLNGEEHTKSFISHQDIMDGGELIFHMGPEPNKTFATDENDLPVSAINDEKITPVPYVKTGDRTFVESTVVSLDKIIPEGQIFFTLDGSDPTRQSAIYNDPFTVDKSLDLKAIVSGEGIPDSKVLIASFHKIPVGRTIRLNTEYASQYSGGGDLCLIDFIRGPLNFRTGAWQGYHGVDLNAIVDLGSIKLITKLETGFLQDVGAWIFMPEKVDYYVSTDGKEFQLAGTVINDISPGQPGVNIKNFSLNFSAKARYIKVVAKNMGTCPEWHVGEGQPAWIFADEIVVE